VGFHLWSRILKYRSELNERSSGKVRRGNVKRDGERNRQERADSTKIDVIPRVAVRYIRTYTSADDRGADQSRIVTVYPTYFRCKRQPERPSIGNRDSAASTTTAIVPRRSVFYRVQS